VEGKLDSEIYQRDVLSKMVPDLIRIHGDGEKFIFMQDGAGEHRSKSTQAYLAKTSLDFWPVGFWPGNSPDLNPIEGFWSLLRAAVTPPGIYGLKNPEMRKRATLWFKTVTREDCRVAMSGIVRRMRELADSDFWSIAH